MAELGLFGEVVIEAYDPDLNFRGVLTNWQALTARRERYDHQHLEFTVPFESRLFGMQHTKGTFGSRTFWQSKGAEWSFKVFAREYPDDFVHCVVTHCDYEDAFTGRTLEETKANVKIEALGFLDYILSARRVMTADLKRWKRENLKMDDVIKHLLASNVDDSGTPAAYLALPASRADFGSFTVEVVGTNVHPVAPPRVRVSHNTTLLDIAREFCHANSCGMTATCALSGGSPLVVISVTYPERGTDLSDTVIFSRGLNNLQGAKSSTDLLAYSNLFEVDGKAFRQRAKKGWVKIEEGRQELGIRETGEKNDDHWDDEIAASAAFLVSQAQQSYTHFEADIVEGKRRWGYDFDVDDTVTLVDEIQGILRIDRITKVEISSGSPTNLTVRFGHDGGSDGGGGGSSRQGGGKGHRRSGTRPFDKVPEPEVHHTICPDEGEQVIPTQALGRLRVYGDPDVPFNPWFTTGVNNGEDEDAIKELRGAVCEWEVPGPASPGDVEREGKTKVTVPPQECCTEEQWVWCPGGWVEVFAKFCFKPGQKIGEIVCSSTPDPESCCASLLSNCVIRTPAGNNDTCLDGHIYIELPSNDCRGPKLCAKCEGGEAEGITKTKVPGQWEWDLWTGKCSRDGDDKDAVISPAKRAGSTWVPNPTPPCPEP